jgi:predicted ATPase
MAQEIGEQVLRLAQQTSDSLIFLIAHSLLAVPFASRGEFTAAREHFDKGVSLYDPQQHRFMASMYGDDPGVTCLSLRAINLWFLGYPDQAFHSAQEGLALARDLHLPYNLAFASDILAWIHFYRGEPQAAQACLDLLFPLVNEQGFEFFAAESQILQGWVLTEQGQGDEGLARMRPGISAYQATGAEMSRPSHLSLLARTYGKVGQADNGLAALAEAFAIMNRTGEFGLAAELYRLKGELLLQQLEVHNSDPSGTRPQRAKGKKTRG